MQPMSTEQTAPAQAPTPAAEATAPVEAPVVAAQAISLNEVLAQSRRLDALVKDCAQALASLQVGLRGALVDVSRLPALEGALVEGEVIERKMREASQGLSGVRRALEREVRDRILVDHQLAAAVEQKEGGRRAALHDVLTGLANRALFHDRLEYALTQAERHSRAVAVMFVDLDDFKVINDSHGHDAGDRVLQETAHRLQESVRGEDTVSRHGGDEFLCLLTDVRDEVDLVAIATKVLQAIRSPCHIRVGNLEIHPSVQASIGISIFPKDGRTAAALVKRADAAMYSAKRTKSRYAFAR